MCVPYDLRSRKSILTGRRKLARIVVYFVYSMPKTGQRFFQKLAILSWKQKIAIFASVILVAVFFPQHFTHAVSSIGEDQLMGIATILAWIVSALAWAIGKMIVLTISIIVIPLLGYNNFADSNIISVGWPLVRDTVNMFVIVILLVIAIKTMLGFGGNKIQWEQQLPRLFLAVVAVNFSRTLCVLMIDASQVVMMTFVNALRDIAAGNFVGLFQLDSFMGISSDTLEYAAQGASTADALGYLGSSYLILILLGMVLATLWILAFVFLYRIVILWVLVIMSPVAFFLGGLKEVFGEAAGKYGDWWKQFVGAITVGPIMAFFLWLGLAAASQGSIAASEGFELGVQADSTYGLLNEVFQVEKILSLFIGYIIIIAGFRASASAASSLGGVASTLISEGAGMALGKRVAAAPARLAGRGVAAGGRAFERRTGIAADLGKAGVQAGGALQERLGGGFVGGIVGGAVSGASARLEGVGRGVEKEDKKARREVIDSYSDAQLATTTGVLENVDNIKSLPYEQQKIAIEVTKDLATDKTTQAKVKNRLIAQYGKEEGKKRYKKRLDEAERYLIANGDKFKADDPANKEKLDKVRKKRVDVVAERVAKGKEGLDDLQDVIKDMTPKDFKKAAINNEMVRQEAQKRTVRTYRDVDGKEVDVKLWDEIQAGRGGTALEVQKEAEKVLFKNFKESESLGISDALTQGYQFKEDKSGNIKKEKVEIKDVQASDFTDRKDPEKLVLGIAQSNADLTGMNGSARAAFVTEARKLKGNKDAMEKFADEMNMKPKDLELSIDAALISADNDYTSVYDDAADDIKIDKADFERMIELRPQIVTHFKRPIAMAETAGTPTNLTQSILNASTRESLEKAAKTAVLSGTKEAKKQVETYMTQIEKSAQLEYDHYTDARATKSKEKTKGIKNAATQAKNLMS